MATPSLTLKHIPSHNGPVALNSDMDWRLFGIGNPLFG